MSERIRKPVKLTLSDDARAMGEAIVVANRIRSLSAQVELLIVREAERLQLAPGSPQPQTQEVAP